MIDRIVTGIMVAFVIAGSPFAVLVLGLAQLLGLWKPVGRGTSGDLGMFCFVAFVFGVAEAVALGCLLGIGVFHIPHITVEWR